MRSPRALDILSAPLAGAAAAVIASLGAPVVAAADAAVEAADRPSFVWLVSEDNSKHHLALFDEAGAATPRIGELARDGLVFEHAFANAPVCSVARTTLITGCHAPRIGTQFHRRAVAVPLPDGLRMFPAYLREAGYHTTNRAKKDYNAVEGADVWDESSNRATWRDRRPGQPFFHFRSFAASHEGTLHFGERALREEPTGTDPASVTPVPYHPDTETFRYTLARYHDRIRQVDREVGEVVDQLAADGLLEDTFVFYFGDHGGVLPRGKGYLYESGLHVPLVVRIPDKWRHLVPMGLARGSRVAGFVEFVDFGPTLLRLAGLGIPAAMDGRPFLGAGIEAAALDGRDEAIGYADRFDEKVDLVRSLRKGRFKYLRSYQPFTIDGLQNNYRYRMLAYREWRDLHRAGRLNAVQSAFFEPRAPEALYDLESDPHETTDLSGDPAHAATLAELRGRLGHRVRSLPDLSFFPESVLVREAFDDPVGFGRAHREAIAGLVDLADLQLVPFAEARGRLAEALASGDPWHRYWALIVCTTHGAAAAEVFGESAVRLAADDPVPLVRVRAAEFLGLTGTADPVPAITAALEGTADPVEAVLVLNTLVLLRDTPPGYAFDIDPNRLHPSVRADDQVRRRLDYLAATQDHP